MAVASLDGEQSVTSGGELIFGLILGIEVLNKLAQKLVHRQGLVA